MAFNPNFDPATSQITALKPRSNAPWVVAFLALGGAAAGGYYLHQGRQHAREDAAEAVKKAQAAEAEKAELAQKVEKLEAEKTELAKDKEESDRRTRCRRGRGRAPGRCDGRGRA